MLTDGSAASILATRDWLDPMAFATAVCVRRLLTLRSRSPSDKANFKSTRAASASVRSRNSSADPTFRHLHKGVGVWCLMSRRCQIGGAREGLGGPRG